MSLSYQPNTQKNVNWKEISEKVQTELRITGKTAYDILFEDQKIEDLDHIRVYGLPEHTQRIQNHSIFKEDHDYQKLNIKNVEERPSANPYPTEEADELYIVEPDTWINDLRNGNDRYFQINIEEDAEFRENILSAASDELGREIKEILTGNY